MQLVPEPAEGDEVIEAGGARVFASEDASVMLSEQQLDAGQTDEGTGFSLRPQDCARAAPGALVPGAAGPGQPLSGSRYPIIAARRSGSHYPVVTPRRSSGCGL